MFGTLIRLRTIYRSRLMVKVTDKSVRSKVGYENQNSQKENIFGYAYTLVAPFLKI